MYTGWDWPADVENINLLYIPPLNRTTLTTSVIKQKPVNSRILIIVKRLYLDRPRYILCSKSELSSLSTVTAWLGLA